MKTLFIFLTITFSNIGIAQIYGDYFLLGYEINGIYSPTPENEEISFVITIFGNDWDESSYEYKETTICEMRRYEVEYPEGMEIKIVGPAGVNNTPCTVPENQVFQSGYFDLFPDNAIFNIAYIDMENSGGIELSRKTESGDYITVYYSGDLITNDPINPVQNLQWEHWYEFPENYFSLSWEEPVQPHSELIGYNIYREDELYRFQAETYLRYIPDFMGESNSDMDFLLYPEENPGEFYVHVTALYEGGIESDYTETILVNGTAMTVEDIKTIQFRVFPNPTKDFLNFSDKIKEITIYDLSGKAIKTQKGLTKKLNVNGLPKGTYILKGTSSSGGKFNTKFVKY